MGWIIKIIIFIMLVYMGIVAGGPHVKYFIFKNTLNDTVEKADLRDVNKEIMIAADGLGIPLDVDNITKEEYSGKIIYTIKYHESVTVPVIKKKLEYDFKIEKKKELE